MATNSGTRAIHPRSGTSKFGMDAPSSRPESTARPRRSLTESPVFASVSCLLEVLSACIEVTSWPFG